MAYSRSVTELEVLFEWIAGIGRHERSSKALRRIQALFRHFDKVMFATKRMGKVPAIAPPFHTPPASLSSCSLGLDRQGGPRSVWYCFALDIASAPMFFAQVSASSINLRAIPL